MKTREYNCLRCNKLLLWKRLNIFSFYSFLSNIHPRHHTQEDEQLDYLDLYIHTLLSLLKALIVHSLNFIERTQQFRVNICPSDIQNIFVLKPFTTTHTYKPEKNSPQWMEIKEMYNLNIKNHVKFTLYFCSFLQPTK